MKVTTISSLPPLKGVSKYSSALLKALSADIEVDVINFKRMYPEFLYPGSTKDESLKMPQLANVSVRTLLTWYNPFGWLYAGLTVKGDMVHAQWWSYILAPVYVTILFVAKFLRRKKIVITVHNVKPHEQGFIKKLANRSVFFLGDHFIVHNEENKKTFAKEFGVHQEEISVVPHGVLVPDTPHKGFTKNSARKMLGVSKDAKVLLFFGIIREYKGLEVLLTAFAEVKKENSNALLIIAGKPWESWKKYQKIIDKNNLGGSVKTNLEFIPEDEIEVYFQAADLVVLSYKHFDAQSGAGSLALPFGKAMLVTDTGGLSQLVKDEAAIAKPGDPDNLARKIISIISNAELQKKLGKDSEALSEELSWNSISKATIKLYERMLTNG